jgi:hypothetical protein
MQHDEPVLYGYVAEWADALKAFRTGWNGYLDWNYGRAVTALVMGSYFAHENGPLCVGGWDEMVGTIADYAPAIQQRRGGDVL